MNNFRLNFNVIHRRDGNDGPRRCHTLAMRKISVRTKQNYETIVEG